MVLLREVEEGQPAAPEPLIPRAVPTERSQAGPSGEAEQRSVNFPRYL